MKARCEFWKLSSTGDAVGTVLMKTVVANAVEFTDTTEDYALPNAANSEAYAMKVIAIEGMIIAEVKPVDDLTNSDDQSGWIAEGDFAWFFVEPDSALFLAEYEAV